MHELNLTVISGRLAAEPELKVFESGSLIAKLLVTVRTTEPKRRVDVLPVVWWNPDPDVMESLSTGCGVWIAGSCQRRFWSQEDGRRSRIEIVAHEVSIRQEETTQQVEETKTAKRRAWNDELEAQAKEGSR